MNRAISKVIKSDSSAEDKINKLLELIIDELHPSYKSISDELLEVSTETYGVFSRKFKNKQTGQEKKLVWKVTYGTPETVKTEFLP